MKDIVRILEGIALDNNLVYHYGKKAALNLLDGSTEADTTYLLHEFTNRKSEYNDIANVKKIASTKPPKAEKGALFSIGGQRHSAGGTLFTGADGTQFEAEQGELIGVMNRNAARHFMAFNNAFSGGGASAPNYFAGGGIVSREIAQQSLNTDELALKIAEANRNLPPPVVAVQDIVTEGNSYVRVRDSANF
ncbi:hypothetical protein [Flavobacterium sp. AG291]|uniref:hypothetical protein n=1 Tax=Flavobacterium sp. AG291 TaxID=2184000 RepID=UPI000E0A2D21|nr:hypothetical protein [Flavobacterium sp. AG291]RDI11969.1 hypothetical protein DEU42_105131 [Flavobacterium sp. AG291]